MTKYVMSPAITKCANQYLVKATITNWTANLKTLARVASKNTLGLPVLKFYSKHVQ